MPDLGLGEGPELMETELMETEASGSAMEPICLDSTLEESPESPMISEADQVGTSIDSGFNRGNSGTSRGTFSSFSLEKLCFMQLLTSSLALRTHLQF